MTRRTRAVTTAAALLLALAGCGGQDPSPSPSPSSTSRSAAERAYLDALGKIDPGLVEKQDRAISRGENTCQTIEAGDSHAKVVSMAQERFTGGDVEVDKADAERIVEAAKTHLCPS